LYILHDDADVEHAGYHHDTSAENGCAPNSCAPASCAPAGLVSLASSSAADEITPTAAALPQAATTPASSKQASTARNDWFHNLTQPLPERIDLADDSCDEVQLQGTLNVEHDPEQLVKFLAEVRRVLRVGGQVLAHGLVADRPLTTKPALPGPAALVSFVPLEKLPAEALQAAGFVNVQYTKLGATPCFTVGDAQLRESKVTGIKPAAATIANNASTAIDVIYRGPFRSATDDRGHTYERGERVSVCSATLAMLKSGPLAEQFAILDGTPSRGGCGR
jgi:hypothetical protein